MKAIDYQREVFGMLFKTSNAMQVYLDTMLVKDELTAKQMYLMIIVSTFKDKAPTLKEVADKSSSSYQNVKQLALKLESKGYIAIVSGDQDRRKKHLLLTEKAKLYWEDRDEKDLEDMNKLFSGCSHEELKAFLHVTKQLLSNMDCMEDDNV